MLFIPTQWRRIPFRNYSFTLDYTVNKCQNKFGVVLEKETVINNGYDKGSSLDSSTFYLNI